MDKSGIFAHSILFYVLMANVIHQVHPAPGREANAGDVSKGLAGDSTQYGRSPLKPGAYSVIRPFDGSGIGYPLMAKDRTA